MAKTLPVNREKTRKQRSHRKKNKQNRREEIPRLGLVNGFKVYRIKTKKIKNISSIISLSRTPSEKRVTFASAKPLILDVGEENSDEKAPFIHQNDDNKKRSGITKQKNVLGLVNGFKVTKNSDTTLGTMNIFPRQMNDSETAESLCQEAGPSVPRARTRRTHSARDSSEDLTSEDESTRDVKRRRTLETEVIESSDSRKTTRSKRLINLSTPAASKVLESDDSVEKRIYPRTPGAFDQSDMVSDITFEDISDEEADPDEFKGKVTLERLFNEENLDKESFSEVPVEIPQEKNLNSEPDLPLEQKPNASSRIGKELKKSEQPLAEETEVAQKIHKEEITEKSKISPQKSSNHEGKSAESNSDNDSKKIATTNIYFGATKPGVSGFPGEVNPVQKSNKEESPKQDVAEGKKIELSEQGITEVAGEVVCHPSSTKEIVTPIPNPQRKLVFEAEKSSATIAVTSLLDPQRKQTTSSSNPAPNPGAKSKPVSQSNAVESSKPTLEAKPTSPEKRIVSPPNKTKTSTNTVEETVEMNCFLEQCKEFVSQLTTDPSEEGPLRNFPSSPESISDDVLLAPLAHVDVSRLTRRSVSPSDTVAEDVFKQRRSQIVFDDEEPMEVSVMNHSLQSRLSKSLSTVSEKQEEGGEILDEKVVLSGERKLRKQPQDSESPTDVQKAVNTPLESINLKINLNQSGFMSNDSSVVDGEDDLTPDSPSFTMKEVSEIMMEEEKEKDAQKILKDSKEEEEEENVEEGESCEETTEEATGGMGKSADDDGGQGSEAKEEERVGDSEKGATEVGKGDDRVVAPKGESIVVTEKEEEKLIVVESSVAGASDAKLNQETNVLEKSSETELSLVLMDEVVDAVEDTIQAISGKQTDVPREEVPRTETPEKEVPRVETPEKEAPRVETPEKEAPRVETPEKEAPRVETPEKEAPRVETPEKEAPRVETPERESPRVKTPEKEALRAKTPEKEAAQTKTPEKEVAQAEAPEKEVPNRRTTEKEVPQRRTPEKKAPRTKTPEKEVPEAEASEKEVPQAEAPEKEVPQTENVEKELPSRGTAESNDAVREKTPVEENRQVSEDAAEVPDLPPNPAIQNPHPQQTSEADHAPNEVTKPDQVSTSGNPIEQSTIVSGKRTRRPTRHYSPENTPRRTTRSKPTAEASSVVPSTPTTKKRTTTAKTPSRVAMEPKSLTNVEEVESKPSTKVPRPTTSKTSKTTSTTTPSTRTTKTAASSTTSKSAVKTSQTSAAKTPSTSAAATRRKTTKH